MNKLGFWFSIAFLIALFAPTGIVTMYGAGIELMQTKVIKRDSRGRVEVMETRATGGICTAHITYNKRQRPQIYVFALSRAGVHDFGPMELEGETEETLSAEALEQDFDLAMQFCLPLIVPGYVRV